MKIELDKVREIVKDIRNTINTKAKTGFYATHNVKGMNIAFEAVLEMLDMLEMEILGEISEEAKPYFSTKDQPKPKMYLHTYLRPCGELRYYKSPSEKGKVLVADLGNWELIKTEPWNE